MFVRDYMTAAPITIAPTTPILEAMNIMRKHKIRHLPVVEKNRLIGLVTEGLLLKVSPSPATTLSIYEINYLLAKMVVREVMVKNPITVTPSTTLEEAALIMRDHKVGSLLVVEDERLIGIITQTDIFDALIRIFGLRKAGLRIVLETENRIGALAEVLDIVRQHGISVVGVAVEERPDQTIAVMLRLATAEADPLVEDFTARGYRVKSVS